MLWSCVLLCCLNEGSDAVQFSSTLLFDLPINDTWQTKINQNHVLLLVLYVSLQLYLAGPQEPKDSPPKQSVEGDATDAADLAKPADANMSLVDFNTYVSPQFRQAADESGDMRPLGIKKISSAFIKKLESHLNVILWDILQDLQCGEKTISVNMKAISSNKGKTDGLHVCYPVTSDVRLPFVNHVKTLPCKGSIPFAEMFGAIWLNYFVWK